MANVLWRAFNAGINFCVVKPYYFFGVRRPLHIGRFRVAALKRIAKAKGIRPSLVQECIRVRQEIIDAIGERGPEIEWKKKDQAGVLIDITDEVKKGDDNPGFNLSNLPVLESTLRRVDWRHFLQRVKHPKDYAIADVDLVVFSVTGSSSGQQIVGHIDYFYSDLRHGRIQIVINKAPSGPWGLIAADGIPSHRVQRQIGKRKIPTRAYPVSLGDTAEFMSQLALPLGVKPVMGEGTSIYWPAR
jgi:hypothetical protein